MEALKRWWTDWLSWRTRALRAERNEETVRADLLIVKASYRDALMEMNVLREKIAILQMKVLADAKKVRRRI